MVIDDISIHALRVEGDKAQLQTVDDKLISIHALRVEGDMFSAGDIVTLKISIHALRVEGDGCRCWGLGCCC